MEYITVVLIIIIDLLFSIWSALGKIWYWYFLNFIILYTISSIFNTSYIQCLTRCYSVIVLKGKKGIIENIGMIILTLALWYFGYLICRFCFQNHIQIGLFFLACLAISTIEVFIDNHFQVAIERTKDISERIKKK